MQGNPTDIFDEMDEMFSRLFSRMEREFAAGIPQGYAYPIMVRDEGEGLEIQEIADDAAPSLSRVTGEPVAEVHRIGDQIKVIAGLPGITEEALRLDVKKNTLIIDAGDADNHYHTAAVLPPVDAASMQKTLKNGVLEVTFTSLPDRPEKA
jgi:HSP20 family molecular chaperone IbpA